MSFSPVASSKRSMDQPVNVAAPQRDVELAQRHLGIGAFQIVAGPEQGGVAAAHGGLRIALSPGDGAEAVETPGDGGDEAPLALHVGGDRAEQGGRGLVRPMGAAQSLDRLVGPPARLQQVMDTPRGIAAAEIGVIAAPGAAGHGEDEDAFIARHEGGGLGEVGRGRAVAQRQALAGCIGDAQDPARAAGDLGDGLAAEAMQDLVQRRLHRRQCRELLDQGIAGGHGFLAQDRVALGVGHGPAHQIALVVGERFLQLHREGVGQILQARLPWRQVDGDVFPFRDGDIGDAPVQQRLAGGDQLDDAGMAGLEIGFYGPDQRGAFHGGQEMAEEALLGALESRQRGGLGVLVQRGIALHDAGGFERVFYIAVDHLEGAGIGVVDAPLFGRERMFERLDLDPVIAERTGLVEPEGFQIAGHHLHRRHPAGLHGGDEIGALLEGCLAARIRAAPQAEAPRIGKSGHRGGTGGGDIEDAGIGQGVLQTQSGAALLRGGRIAA